MMFILRDDLFIETFESPHQPPSWIEWIDVENEEYQFCSDQGQRYRGELLRPAGFFRAEDWHLVPIGAPDLANALSLIDLAQAIEPTRCNFPDLESLRRYVEEQRE